MKIDKLDVPILIQSIQKMISKFFVGPFKKPVQSDRRKWKGWTTEQNQTRIETSFNLKPLISLFKCIYPSKKDH